MDRPDFNLPTPQMLIKKAKEETIPVSLRVKESTVAIFDKMAKEAGVNRGAMMNTLLDFYAQNQNSSNNNNSKDIMISYLNSERFWKNISSLTPKELIYRFKAKGVDTPEAEEANWLYDAYKENDTICLCAFIGPESENSIMDEISVDDTIKCIDYDENTNLRVTKDQWPLIVALLNEYDQKYRKVFPEQPFSLTPGLYDKIAEACKKNNKADSKLALAIKNILLDYVEKQND